MKINEILTPQQAQQIQQDPNFINAKAQNPGWTPDKWIQAVQAAQGRAKEAPAIKQKPGAATQALKGLSSVLPSTPGFAVKPQASQSEPAPVGTTIQRGNVVYTKKYQGWIDNANRLVPANIAQVLDKDWEQDSQRRAKIAGYGAKPDSLKQAYQQGVQQGQAAVAATPAQTTANTAPTTGNVQAEGTGLGATVGAGLGAAVGGVPGAALGGYIGSKIGGANDNVRKVQQPAGTLDRLARGVGKLVGQYQASKTSPQTTATAQSTSAPTQTGPDLTAMSDQQLADLEAQLQAELDKLQ